MLRLSPYWLWVLLALPAFGFSVQLARSDDPRVVKQLFHPTGEFSARFMIIAMLASPLVLLLRGWRGPQWLKKKQALFWRGGVWLCRHAYNPLSGGSGLNGTRVS